MRRRPRRPRTVAPRRRRGSTPDRSWLPLRRCGATPFAARRRAMRDWTPTSRNSGSAQTNAAHILRVRLVERIWLTGVGRRSDMRGECGVAASRRGRRDHHARRSTRERARCRSWALHPLGATAATFGGARDPRRLWPPHEVAGNISGSWLPRLNASSSRPSTRTWPRPAATRREAGRRRYTRRPRSPPSTRIPRTPWPSL